MLKASRAAGRAAIVEGIPGPGHGEIVLAALREQADELTWKGGRLPTEAEWELAARGTDGRFYP